MNNTLAITTIALVAVAMGMSSVLPSVQAFSVFTQTLPDQIAEENGIDLDGLSTKCQKGCADAFRATVALCKVAPDRTACIQEAVTNMKNCITRCRAAGV